MAKGGARSVSGPPPDPMALRRDRPSDRDGWTTLPPAGRRGDTPPWPLAPVGDVDEDDASARRQRELDVWWRLWSKPQAVQWERHGLDLEVALYVRRLVESEAPGSPVALSTLVRQLGEALGLTPVGMLRLRWRIGAAPAAVPEQGTPAPGPRRRSARSRLKVVEPDADEGT